MLIESTLRKNKDSKRNTRKLKEAFLKSKNSIPSIHPFIVSLSHLLKLKKKTCSVKKKWQPRSSKNIDVTLMIKIDCKDIHKSNRKKNTTTNIIALPSYSEKSLPEYSAGSHVGTGVEGKERKKEIWNLDAEEVKPPSVGNGRDSCDRLKKKWKEKNEQERLKWTGK